MDITWNICSYEVWHTLSLVSQIGRSVQYTIDKVDPTLYDKICQWLAVGRWFSPGTLVSSTNKTDSHDITEILLKVAFNTITLTLLLMYAKTFKIEVIYR